MRVDLGYFEHPKVKKLERTLGDAAALIPLKLWRWAVLYARDGEIEADQLLDVAVACSWAGEPERLVAQLERAGFLERLDGKRLRIHDWSEHQGRAVERARADAERHRAYRARLARERAAASAGRPADEPETTAAGPVTVPAVDRSASGSFAHLLAYADALAELWPLQPMPDRVGVERELLEQAPRLPDLATFRANCEAWFASEQWSDRAAKHIPRPVNFLRDGTYSTPPPKRRAAATAVTVDQARRTLFDDIERAKLPESIRDEFIRRVTEAKGKAELAELAREIQRARAA